MCRCATLAKFGTQPAVARLGELQAADAIDDLIKLITFKRTFPQDKTPGGIINELHTITRDGRYPAVGSLFLIGKPSLSALTKLISDSDPDSLETENALEAVKLIFRDEPKAGVQCLKGVAEKSQYPLEKERLLYAAKRLENFTP